MKCLSVYLSNGTRAIVCASRRPTKRCACGASSTKLCDAPHPTRKNGTCDKPLCGNCAVPIGPNVDYCSHHPAPPP